MALGQGWSCPAPPWGLQVSRFRMKYIETELKKRKGIVEHEEQKVKPKNAEDCLYELPENIRVSSAKKTEEMLSNQMLSGIPEVDLGIEWVSDPQSRLSPAPRQKG